MKRTKKISLKEYGMGLYPLNFKLEIAKAVQLEDEVFHARNYKRIEIPEMKYPSGKWRPTAIKAFINQVTACLP